MICGACRDRADRDPDKPGCGQDCGKDCDCQHQGQMTDPPHSKGCVEYGDDSQCVPCNI